MAAIREKERITQEAFAKRYGFTASAVRDWEQGRRRPERSARILLALIRDESEAVRRVVRNTALKRALQDPSAL